MRTNPSLPNESPLLPSIPFRLSGHLLTVAVLTALAAGCVVEEEEARPLEIERDGEVFDLVGPVVEQEVEPGPDAVVMPRRAFSEEPDEVIPLDTWSREELADMLRPVIATGDDAVYVAREPAWEAADAVLSGSKESLSYDVLDRDGEGRPSVEPDDMTMRQIIGTDGRSRVVNTTAAPYNSIVKLQLYTGNTYRGSCSGSYIGPWTLITSAHCLVFSNTDRVNRIVFQPARNGGTLPYGSFDCRLDDASSTNDYLWSVPAGYFTGQEGSLDYAVMDTFPCHSAPNWFGGYQTNAGNSTFATYGYPGDTCPGAPGPSNYMCGMSGPSELNDWRIESQHIDAIAGQSGSPWYRMYDINRPVGVLWGYREYGDFFKCGFDVCRRNFARRIDNAFSNFIVSVAWDY